MMRKGELSEYPVTWVLREASREGLTGGIELHVDGATTSVHLTNGEVYLVIGEGEDPGVELDEQLDDAAYLAAVREADAELRRKAVVRLSRLLGRDEGWYFYHELNLHPLNGEWAWDTAELLADAELHRQDEVTAARSEEGDVGEAMPADGQGSVTKEAADTAEPEAIGPAAAMEVFEPPEATRAADGEPAAAAGPRHSTADVDGTDSVEPARTSGSATIEPDRDPFARGPDPADPSVDSRARAAPLSGAGPGVTAGRRADDVVVGPDPFLARPDERGSDPDGWQSARPDPPDMSSGGAPLPTQVAGSRLADGPFAHPPPAPEPASPQWSVPPAAPPSWIEGDAVELIDEPPAEVDADQWAVLVALAETVRFEELAERLGWTVERLRDVLDGMVDDGLVAPAALDEPG